MLPAAPKDNVPGRVSWTTPSKSAADESSYARGGALYRQQVRARCANATADQGPVVDARLHANDFGSGLCLSNDVFFGRGAVEYLLSRPAMDCRQVW